MIQLISNLIVDTAINFEDLAKTCSIAVLLRYVNYAWVRMINKEK